MRRSLPGNLGITLGASLMKLVNNALALMRLLRGSLLNYYSSLLGTSASVLPFPSHLFLHDTVPPEKCGSLIQPVRVPEILDALKSIDRNKSPSIDGYSSGFFLDAWNVVGKDFKNAVLVFFQICSMPKVDNSTLLVLVPKMETPLTVKDFRPIGCCTTFYKVISKILANRLKQVLDSIVGPEQAAFVADRDIFDNIMLAHELVSKYGRAYLTPRCLLKVDIRKAFDSVNWTFLKDCMLYLHFPSAFVDWIMACITFPYYSLLINGVFPWEMWAQARGDLPSVKAVSDCLDLFSTLSSLVANPAKTDLYFGGVAADVKTLILAAIGFSESNSMHWANKNLSYAWKTLLVNSVIFGLNNIWGASILLPKVVIKKINKICKDFLWGIFDGARRHTFLKWQLLCSPKLEGGIGIKEVLSWNCAQMIKWVWKLHNKPLSIWTRWVQTYVLKGQSLWSAKQTISNSWYWNNVVKMKDLLLDIAGSPSLALQHLERCTSHARCNTTYL
ncbi:uncharacterized protein LOC141651925 [Silene latifolia]|uniref:uncharacterized protein LOC141651925 n=1 Tax=Silene latifolia TaxID=37657 RepID=UPI003D77419E